MFSTHFLNEKPQKFIHLRVFCAKQIPLNGIFNKKTVSMDQFIHLGSFCKDITKLNIVYDVRSMM